LSAEFLRAVELNLGYVLRNPDLFAEVLPGIRRIGLRRFPYSLFYRVRGQKITVLACLHQHRDPDEWPHN
jgi:plasmid stabilization system protein ParE